MKFAILSVYLLLITGIIGNIESLSLSVTKRFKNGSFNCNDSNQYYTEGVIVDRETSITNTTNGTKIYNGEVTVDYKLFGLCLYSCKMDIIKDQKYGRFVLNHIDELYAIGGSLHLFCNSSLCYHTNNRCVTFNIRDEL